MVLQERPEEGETLSHTLKSDDLCEQLAIFGAESGQSHQEAPERQYLGWVVR